jgi:predicted nucleic acid-binding protein
MDARAEDLFLSVVTLAEIEDGVAKLRREGAVKKAAGLAEWLQAVLHWYGERILPVDVAVARVAGGLLDTARGQGQSPGLADVLITATAQCHGLTVLTRNVRHFAVFGGLIRDPFLGLPVD